MTIESDKQFNDRRAIDEKTLPKQAIDSVDVISHGQLSKLHADEARACDTALHPQETALEVTASDGNIAVAVGGEVAFLTPQAAGRTADRLLARARGR